VGSGNTPYVVAMVVLAVLAVAGFAIAARLPRGAAQPAASDGTVVPAPVQSG
jgi:hypothetical protein